MVVHERIRSVYDFMIKVSKQRKDVIQHFTKKWTEDGYFNDNTDYTKHRIIDRYIQKVKFTFFNFEKEVEGEKGRTLARLDYLFHKLEKNEDYKGALLVLREIKDIIGFDAVKRTHISQDVSDETMKKIFEFFKNEY
jgi:hypothetical protein